MAPIGMGYEQDMVGATENGLTQNGVWLVMGGQREGWTKRCVDRMDQWFHLCPWFLRHILHVIGRPHNVLVTSYCLGI